jgi:membrane-bound serine protease (ClpP class)
LPRGTVRRTDALRVLAFCLMSAVVLDASASAGQRVDVIRVEGVINPVAARFVEESIDRAAQDGSLCLIVELDTPGGLMESMRSMVKKIMNSSVPVVVYVSPAGAQDASAGVFITMAAHLAAMAPGTNIGAAHPVTMGQEMDEEMKEKVTNDAVSYIRGIAAQRGRNADWAERAVRQSESVTAEEAHQLGVVELVCQDLDQLLEVINGRQVETSQGTVTLQTEGAELRRFELSFRYRVLNIISNPNVAYILLILGFYGLFFELSNPGAFLPGIAGGICIILAFFAFQVLPINYAGLLLILFAIILFIAELLTPTFGFLTTGGVIAMILGSLMLIGSPAPFMRISWKIIVPVTIATAAFFLFALGMSLKTRLRKPTTGKKGLVGEIGVAQTRLAPDGRVFLHGELWNAECQEVVEKGEKVRVVAVEEHLKLKVVKLTEREG